MKDFRLDFGNVKIQDPQEFKKERDVWLEKNQKTRKYRPSPSSSGNCSRQNVYNRLGFPKQEKTEARMLDLFSDGYAHEDSMIKAFSDFCETKGWKVIVPKEKFQLFAPGELGPDPMNGIHDFEVDFKDGSAPIIIEMKSASKSSFDWVMKQGPYEKHREQLNFYLWHLERPYGWIVYKCKNDSRWEVFLHTYDPKLLEKCIEKIKSEEDSFLELKPYVKEGKWIEDKSYLLPKRPYWKSSMECGWCAHRDECWRTFKDSILVTDDTELGVLAETYEGMKTIEDTTSTAKDSIKKRILEKMTSLGKSFIMTPVYDIEIRQMYRGDALFVRKRVK